MELKLFLFLPIGRFSAPVKTNKQVLVPFEKVNKEESVPAKKLHRISVQGMYGQCPNSTNCRRAKTPEFETSVHIFRQYFQKLRGKNNRI